MKFQLLQAACNQSSTGAWDFFSLLQQVRAFPEKYEFNKEEGVMYGPVDGAGGGGRNSREISSLRYARYCIRNISYALLYPGELYRRGAAAAGKKER